MSELLAATALAQLVGRWIADGSRVAGPQCAKPHDDLHRHDLIRYGWLTAAEQLLLDGFIRPLNSIKEFVFPRHEELYGYRFQGKQIELLPVGTARRRADRHRGPAVRRGRAADPRSGVQLGLPRRVLQSPPRVDHRRHAGLPRARRPLLLHVGRFGPRRHARLGRAADCRWATTSTKCAA